MSDYVKQLEERIIELEKALEESFKENNNKKIVFQITDNGKGFDINQKTKSFGLLGMQERAGMMNGTLNITSEFGKGSSIHVEVEI